jgi:hypothetical protein
MARQEAPDEEWDKDTDEINSLASDELHETRPNRWTGAPSTWYALVEQERTAHRALETARNGDLALHLYNVFALKNGLRAEACVPDPAMVCSYSSYSLAFLFFFFFFFYPR